MDSYTGGFPKHTNYLAKELSKYAEVIKTEIINDHFEPKEADVHIILNLYEKWEKHTIHHLKGIKIAYLVYEGTKLAPNKLAAMNLNQIWTPSQWFKNVLISHKIEPNRIKIIPEGTDSHIYHLNARKHNKIASISAFKFLSMGRIDERKNVAAMIRAFDEEFDKDDAVLVLFYRGFNKKSFGIKNPHKIIEIKPNLYSEKLLASLYRACDAYVSPHKAEGWGLTLTEAMACGLPVIATNYSGPTEFLTKENSYLIDYNLINHNFFGQLAEPNMKQFKTLMRKVYETKAQATGLIASNDIKEKWSWDSMGQKAWNEINELLACEP